MPIKVTIAGGIVLEKCLSSVFFNLDTSDDSDARTTDMQHNEINEKSCLIFNYRFFNHGH